MLESTPTSLAPFHRNALIADFLSAWETTETLFSALRTEDDYRTSKSPLIFYFGHSAVFYIQKFRDAGMLEKTLDADLESQFNLTVEEIEPTFPALAALRDYRSRAKETILKLLQTHEGFAHTPAFPMQNLAVWSALMGVENERQHIETASTLMRELPLESVRRPEKFPALFSQEDFGHSEEWLTIAPGLVQLGKPMNSPIFGWDCEYGTLDLQVPAFAAARFLNSNSDFLEFVEDGGYENPNFWSPDGWSWKNFTGATQPRFWVGSAIDGYRLRTCFEVIDMRFDFPAIVNFFEARAFAKWRTERDGRAYRMMTEGEHHRLRQLCAPTQENWPTDWLQTNPLFREANLNLRFGSESSVRRQAASQLPVCDLFGNVWQWSEDRFAPLEGFQPHPLFPDYSTPTFDGHHRLLLGGSFASTGTQAGPWARHTSRPQVYRQAGVRLVSSELAH